MQPLATPSLVFRPPGVSPLLRWLRDYLHERGWLESCTPWTPHSAALLRGRWGRRRLRISEWAGEGAITIRLALRGGPELTVRRATLLQRLDPRRSTTAARLGSLWLSGDPAGLARTLEQPTRAPLETLFGELRLGELDLGRRWARARRAGEPSLAQAGYFSQRVLDVLAELVSLREEPEAPRLTPRQRAVLRCPYCHDALCPERDAAASCGACGTLHHRSCALEASACTTLGCSSLVFHALAPSALVGAPIS